MRRAVVAAVLLAIAGGLLLRPAGGQSAEAPASLRSLPSVGVGDLGTTIIGAAPLAGPREVWGVRTLPTDVAPPSVGGKPLVFGDPGSGASPRGQLAFERWADGTGWQVVATPADENGDPVRGPLPNGLGERVTLRGGVVVAGRDPDRPADDQVVLITRDPGSDDFRYAPTPPSTVVDPAAGEVLATDSGSGRAAVAAFEASGRVGVYIGVLGPAQEVAVARYSGGTWGRELIDAPSGPFKILAIAATTAGGGWLLADDGTPGLHLFRREEPASALAPATWEPVALGGIARRADVTALSGSAQPLTVAPGYVWIDGERPDGQFTLRYDVNREQVTGTFCDAGTGCDHPLGFGFATRYGYRSQAFEDGSRVVTNVVDNGDEAASMGNYATLSGDNWQEHPGGGLPFRPSGAFFSPDDGWIEGPVAVARDSPPSHLTRWPAALRTPLTAVAPEPGKPVAAAESQALAVGPGGGVIRYTPGQGWIREFLLSSTGAVSSSTLRAVAWPEARRAHAVGDLGAMWLWQAETGLWERDPAAPPGFVGNLMGVAFDPADPSRGFAVGREGVLFSYDKSWTQVALPDGYAVADFTAVAFAGRQALVAGGDGLLVQDAPGGEFHPDAGVETLLDSLPARPRLTAVAGLPDGGAVAAGRDVVLERDSATAAWRFAPQPLVDSSPVALAAYRSEGEIRAVVSLSPRRAYPLDEPLPVVDPSLPQPIVPPYPLPGDGYLVRQTANGWRDEQRTAFNANATDRPLKSDPTLALLLDEKGEGWAVGGWSGESDSAGRGSSGSSGSAKADRARVQTSAVQRYFDTADTIQPPAESAAPPDLGGSGIVRFAVAGHAVCEERCAEAGDRGLAPDVTLTRAVARAAELGAQPGGPRFMLYTGGRLDPAQGSTGGEEAFRLGELLTSQPGFPVYPALAEADSAGPGPGPFLDALAGLPAPFGQGAAPRGVEASSSAATAGGPAQTHYAFDSAGDGGTVRVIVIDNSRGSLADSDPFQVPAEPQLPWLQDQLAAAKGRGIPAVVMGSRDLNTHASPALNLASDGDAVAAALRDGGASAYFYDAPEENRAGAIPSGAEDAIPEFGTGTLGYRSPVSNTSTAPDSRFGDTVYLLAQVDVGKRDANTNRAPVTVRAMPVIDNLTLWAVDGTLVRRSRPALFTGLGRRPLSGDRWGQIAGGTPEPPGGDPYVSFPPAQCTTAGCTARITPEFSFESSDPEIGDFVKQDPNSTNLRKPFIGENDKTVHDSASGLFCAFNAGKVTVTIRAGGLAYATEVTVQSGSVQRPCGTAVLSPDKFTPVQPNPTPAFQAPEVQQQPGGPPINPKLPPPPAPQPPAKVVPKPKPSAPLPLPPLAPPLAALVPPTPDSIARAPTQPPPPAGSFARPIPPGGATIRVMEEKREEEAAPEQSSAASAYHPDDHFPLAPYIAGMALIAALAGTSLTLGARRRDRGMDLATASVRSTRPRRRYR